MSKTLRIIAPCTFIFMLSCSTSVTTNETLPVVVDSEIETVSHELTHNEDKLVNDDLRDRIVGSWSTNSNSGQIDLNEDGSYLNCDFENLNNDSAKDKDCYTGEWAIDEHKLVVITEFGDTIASEVHWVFDNVVYLGHDNEDVNQELGWEYGMTKL